MAPKFQVTAHVFKGYISDLDLRSTTCKGIEGNVNLY